MKEIFEWLDTNYVIVRFYNSEKQLANKKPAYIISLEKFPGLGGE